MLAKGWQLMIRKNDFLEMEGEGKPILVMHGGHSNCNEEFGYHDLYQNGFSPITSSRPGYGRTSKDAGESLDLACHYYATLLDPFKNRKSAPDCDVGRRTERNLFRLQISR